MNNSTPNTPILDDDAIREIEALSAKVPDGPWFASADDADDVPDHRRSGLALVDTGRSADWWIARLCEWHVARFIAESKTNVDALCVTVRALRVADRHHYDLWLSLKERHKHKFADADGKWADTCSQCGVTTGDDHDGYDCIAWLKRQLEQVTKERDEWKRTAEEWHEEAKGTK